MLSAHEHFPTSQLPLLSLSLLYLSTLVLSQGTITLALATSNDETATTTSIPFNTLFDASSIQRAVSIHVSHGNNIAIAQDDIQCQCFGDKAGNQALGETFNNVFPGTELGAEPVKIGSIFCADEAGIKKQMVGTTPAPPVAEAATTQVPSATASVVKASTAATSTAALKENVKPLSSSPASSSNGGAPTAFLRFALSSDPSDDSSTQMSVPIDMSIVPFGNKKVFSIVPINLSGTQQSSSSELVCQAFADSKAESPIAAGFRLEEEKILGGGMQTVGSVGCAMLGTGGFGGVVGLVGM
ncbi:MAG: hypothetical protein Q9166_007992 [cf. Caloplaca sp. 2 TL-2023]